MVPVARHCLHCELITGDICVFLCVQIWTSSQNETCSFTTIFIEGGENCTFCNTNVTLETNTTSCNVTVMSIDFSPPSITCPDDIVVESSIDDVILPVSWEIPANATGVVTSTHKPNDTFPVGQTSTVFYLATRNMMTTICNFTVTVERPPMETDATTSVTTTEGPPMETDATTSVTTTEESVTVPRPPTDPTKRPENDNSELVLVLTTVAGFTLWILTLVIVSLVCWCQRCPPRCTLDDDTPKQLSPPPDRPAPRLPNGNGQVVVSDYGTVGSLNHGYDNAPEGVRRLDVDEEVVSVHSEGRVDLPEGSEGDGIILSTLGATSTGDHDHDHVVNVILPENGTLPNTVLGVRRPVIPPGVDDNNGSSDPHRNDDSNNNLYDDPASTIPEDGLF